MAYRNVAYLCTNSTTDVYNAGSAYKAPDGKPLFAVGCIFAANIDGDDPDQASLCFNDTVTEVLTKKIDQVEKLQQLGIKVVLTVLGNHQPAGWSNFTTEDGANAFAGQLAEAVTQYGLDGIDIDDEYSTGSSNQNSLAMVTTLLAQAMPGKIISKALWSDLEYFGGSWNGHTLAENLTFGNEMSYGDTDYGARLEPYTTAGMTYERLGLGVNAHGGTDGPQAATYVSDDDVGGIMVFDVTGSSKHFLAPIAEILG